MKIKHLARKSVLFSILVTIASLLTAQFSFAETDITEMIQIDNNRMRMDRRTSENYFDASLTNISDKTIVGPIFVVVDSISSDSVTVANPDGYTEDGFPYFEYNGVNDLLEVSISTGSKTWRFANPQRTRFSYQVSIWGAVPKAFAFIGPEGGMIEIIDPESNFNGVQIDFPEGSLADGTIVTIEGSTVLDRLFSEDSIPITPQVKISSTQPLNGFVTVRLPLSISYNQDDFTLILHHTEGESFWTPLPVKSISEYNYIEFETRYFSTFAGISYVDMDDETKFNIKKLFHPYIYAPLMREIKNVESEIKGADSFNESFKTYIDFAATTGKQLLAGIELANPSLSSGELNLLVKNELIDLFTGGLHFLYRDDDTLWGAIDPHYWLDAYGCVLGVAIAQGNAMDISTAWASCGIDAVNHIFQISSNIVNTLGIHESLKKKNEFWITADYLQIYYYYNGDLDKIAAHINYTGEATESNLINEAAKFYKRGWYAGNNYDLDKVELLIAKGKDIILEKREEIDSDSDFISAYADNCANVSNPDQSDSDSDGNGDICDNCPDNYNPLQEDTDGDGIGDACDTIDPPVAPNLDLPLDNTTLDSTEEINLSWDYAGNADNIGFCAVVKDRGPDLVDTSDDETVYDSCDDSRSEYHIEVDNEEIFIPPYFLLTGTDYTWAAYSYDLLNDVFSDSSEWWNFSTAAPLTVCTDNDGDGYYVESGCGTEQDCNDDDPERSPGLQEVCDDGKDNNCNGQIDEGCGGDNDPNRIVQVSAGISHTVGLRSNGTVLAVGQSSAGQLDVGEWTDIVSISAGGYHTVGLRSDGTVVAVGMNSNAGGTSHGQLDVGEWTDIVSVSAGGYHTVGLRSDGTVVAVGDNSYSQLRVGEWTNIVAVSGGRYQTVGLRSDGTVVSVGDNRYNKVSFGSASNIIDVSTGLDHTVVLRADGTIYGVGSNRYGELNNTDEWTNVVAVSAGGTMTVGLQEDGTIAYAGFGNNELGIAIAEWTDIVAVSAGFQVVVGVKADGTVLTAGICDSGQCDVDEWNPVPTVTSSTGQIWMDRNLGASKVATSSYDMEAYGDLYQWGRGTDGHEKRDSETIYDLSVYDNPGHGYFILTQSSEPGDWRSPQNNDLWQTDTAINSPCPEGFRLPTTEEFALEREEWVNHALQHALESPINFVMSGIRLFHDLGNTNFSPGACYWTSTIDGERAQSLFFSPSNPAPFDTYLGSTQRAMGCSVRCIQNQ